jgi:hypothetical protein
MGGSQLDSFIKERKDEFLRLSAKELYMCSDIASHEYRGTLDAVRTMLMFSQQVLTREVSPDRHLMGAIFHRLIELSPTHSAALAKIEEFEQLVTNGRYHPSSSRLQNDNNAFLQEDIDRVVVLAHNCGVSQNEIGDVDLAEKLISKSLSLIRYASPQIVRLKEDIQVI